RGQEIEPDERVIARVPAGVGLLELEGRLPAEVARDEALLRVIGRHGLLFEFSAEAQAEAKAAAERPVVLGARRDLREVPTVTIDAPSTRDIDDAISVLPADRDGALRILVSIADVSQAVT